MKAIFKKILIKIFLKLFPEFKPIFNNKATWDQIFNPNISWNTISSFTFQSFIGKNTKIYQPFKIGNSLILDYTYIAQNSNISMTEIGKFCSIGPNFVCGWGIHPTNGLSTAPMFYSNLKQNGITFSETNKIEERKKINIGNDVFIGANVTILDGITIGDGAIIGAGAVVSKDIPSFAIAVGCPIQIKRYRFTETQREKLIKIKWWEFSDDKLKDVEQCFFDVDQFIQKHN